MRMRTKPIVITRTWIHKGSTAIGWSTELTMHMMLIWRGLAVPMRTMTELLIWWGRHYAN